MALAGAAHVALIAATGALEIANINSGDRGGIDGSGLGTPTNPLPVAPTGSDGPRQGSITTINITGVVTREIIDALVDAFRSETDRGVVVIRRNSIQALEIRGD